MPFVLRQGTGLWRESLNIIGLFQHSLYHCNLTSRDALEQSYMDHFTVFILDRLQVCEGFGEGEDDVSCSAAFVLVERLSNNVERVSSQLEGHSDGNTAYQQAQLQALQFRSLTRAVLLAHIVRNRYLVIQ